MEYEEKKKQKENGRGEGESEEEETMDDVKGGGQCFNSLFRQLRRPLGATRHVHNDMRKGK